MNTSLWDSQSNFGPFQGHKSVNIVKKVYWHPLMAHHILGIRETTAILNPESLEKSLLRAFFMIALVAKSRGHILFVNTNPEYSHFTNNLRILTTPSLKLQKNADSVSCSTRVSKSHLEDTLPISYCCFKWVGGTLTNWKQLSKSVLTFAKFSQACEDILVKNSLEFPRYRKVKTCFQGLIQKIQGKTFLAFSEKPDVIFLVNPNENQNLLDEARKLHIPVVALVESNTNLQNIAYPIPGNLSNLEFVYYCVKKLLRVTGLTPRQIV